MCKHCIVHLMLGVTGFPKLDVFLENFRRGGGSFPIQKITLQILLVSKRYILEKKTQCNFQKGGERGGVIANPKNFIANLRILSGFSGKKRNVISKNEGGGGPKYLVMHII